MIRLLLVLLLLAGPALAQTKALPGSGGGGPFVANSCATTNRVLKLSGASTVSCSLLADDGTAVTNTGQFLGPSVAATPAYSFATLSDRGFGYNGASGFLELTHGGTAALWVDLNTAGITASGQFTWDSGALGTGRDTGLKRGGAARVHATNGSTAAAQLSPSATASTTSLAGSFFSFGVHFESLGTPDNGTVVFCRNCDPSVAGATATCAAAGTRTGAMAFRIAGTWKCAS